MNENTPNVQGIVDSNCGELLCAMQDAHPQADVGISVALFYPNDPAVSDFFQYGSAGPGIEITPETVYAIGSVTKVFTATLAAYLNVTGIIADLGQTLVGPYLSNPDCQRPGVSGAYWDQPRGATFLRFATQTSGMPDEAGGPYSTQLFQDELPSCPQIEWWHHNQGEFARHEGSWIYSSAGFVTLGFAVAAAAAKGGRTGGYTALLKDEITSRVGMGFTFAADDVPRGAVMAQGYDKRYPATITDAADLKSTAKDMLAWLGAVYEAMHLRASGATLTPLQQAIADTTMTWIAEPRKPDGKPTNFSMGLGWQIPTIGPAQVLTKNGATSKGGCTCWVGLTRYALDVPPVGIALLTNQDGVEPDETAETILRQIIALG